MKPHKAKQKLPAQFESGLRAVYESEFGLLSKSFFEGLEYVFKTDASDDFSIEDLNDLDNSLMKWSSDCEKLLEQKLSKLPKDHPVRCQISLFGTMDFGRLEVAHTRTLAWLLNPKGEHRFEHALLKSLLGHLREEEEPPAFDVKKVESERFYTNPDEKDAGRIDIWIEGFWKTPKHRRPWLVVIEAKVDASEGDEQLERYDDEITIWEADHARSEVYRVFLTPEGRPADGGRNEWPAISFSSLARIFCNAADSLTAKPGYHFFQLYIAGVLKDILGLPIGGGDDKQNRYKLLAFLKGT